MLTIRAGTVFIYSVVRIRPNVPDSNHLVARLVPDRVDFYWEGINRVFSVYLIFAHNQKVLL